MSWTSWGMALGLALIAAGLWGRWMAGVAVAGGTAAGVVALTLLGLLPAIVVGAIVGAALGLATPDEG